MEQSSSNGGKGENEAASIAWAHEAAVDFSESDKRGKAVDNVARNKPSFIW